MYISQLKLWNFRKYGSETFNINTPNLDVSFNEGLNLLIGENDSGKTMLLKMLYVAVKSWENYKKADEPRNMKELISDKLYWTFQIKKFILIHLCCLYALLFLLL